MKLIKNLAIFGIGVAAGTLGTCVIYGLGLMDGDKIYEDDDMYIRSISPKTNGTQMAMVYDKNEFEGSVKYWLRDN